MAVPIACLNAGCRYLARLQVQTLWLTLALRLEDAFPRRSKVFHLHSHPALPEGHETSFRTNSLNVRTGEIVLLVDELIEVDVFAEGHLRGM